MNDNNIIHSDSYGTGYLIVKVSTARGAIPLENASVYIRGAQESNSGVIFSQTTNNAGLTRKTALPAPSRTLSESPGNTGVFALYDIDIFKEGYGDLHFVNVAVFDSITSIQPAIMIPLPDNKFSDSYSPNENFSPKDIDSTPSGGDQL